MKLDKDSVVVCLLGFACLAATTGCELSYADKSDEPEPSQEEQASDESSGSDSSDETSSDTNQIDSAAEPGFGGEFIDGDPADKGEEIYDSNWNGHDVRCLGADYDGDGYFMSDVIDDTGALELDSDGTATGHNFISPRTGLHYQFQGFREGSYSNDLITENPHVVTEGSGTLRCYWNPVEGL